MFEAIPFLMYQSLVSRGVIVEQWILFSLSISLLLMRFAIRFRIVGPLGFQGDDYASAGTILFTMMYMASIHQAELKGQNLDVTADILPDLTNGEIAQLEYGSKMQLLSWYSYSALIWTLKITILCFYARLTSGSIQAKMVKYVSCATGIAYIAVLLATTFGCYPFHRNWQISPMAPWSCRFRPEILITVTVLNVFTSAGILCIPVASLWTLKVPLCKKLTIALSLSSAIIVISAAIVRASVTFSVKPSAANLNAWGARETVLGTLAVNIPILRLLFTKAFWQRGPYSPECRTQSRKESTLSMGDCERGVILQPYEVGVRNSGESREDIVEEKYRGQDVVVIRTTLEIEHHARQGSLLETGESYLIQSWSTASPTK